MAGKKKKKKKKRTAKEEAFCQEYIIDYNGARSARVAGYSAHTAREIAHGNLSKPYIQDRIDELKLERSERTRITQDMVIQELAKIGFSNIGNYVKFNGAGLDLESSDKLTPEELAAVSSIEMQSSEHGPQIKFRLYDKKAALELLGKHMALFKDKVEHSGSLTFEVTPPPLPEGDE